MTLTVQKDYVSVNSLSQIDKDRLRNAVKEINDSMTRAAAEKDFQKETIDNICDALGLEKKIIRRMAKAYFKSNFNDEQEEFKMFEDFYTIVMNNNNP
jgi:hypothetical protein